MSLEFINNFLERFERITPPNLSIRKGVQKEIAKQTGIKIKLEKITYNAKKSEIYLKISPLEKGEIFIKKENILRALKTEFGKGAPKQIF